MSVNKFPLLFLAFFLAAIPVHAGTYLGAVHGTQASAVELGVLTRSFEQNLSFGVPTMSNSFDATLFDKPVAQANLLYRFNQAKPFVLGLGLSTRLGWESSSTFVMGLGLTAQLSYEFLANHLVPFVQATYMPWTTTMGSPSSDTLKNEVEEYLRFGLRYIF